ncbi:MAG: PEGA domain-containing protein [Butyrivibrio sp.]|jgi:hypothetical protein|uniref:PEGA domain-containing protein n=1 Tax=Butyrivibrio sp. TaxID=28121 RepID=UPI001EBBF40C|nr:PEGA domain-containing protein [Butyrivibrio sp.]MBE5841131.1 PEGA domain-containing protein [Butyrivibrio sp.]
MKSFGKCLKKSISVIMAAAMVMATSSTTVYASSDSDNKISISMIDKYDSADTAAIRAIDTEQKLIRFRNHATGKTYTLSYDNTSMMYDVRGTVLSPSLLEVGQIVDVKFLKSTKHITSLNVSAQAWTIDSTRDHDLVRGDGTARVKGESYKMGARTLIIADGEPALADNILATDKIKVCGIDKEIYSVVVTSGHGYVSLSSDIVEDQSLVGAWIELDNEVIYKISPNMLLSAPEGDYNLQILGNGANYKSEVSISRNQETVVDTSEITINKPKEGLVTFQIVPESAEVFVDGEKVLTGIPQSVKYGYHNLKIMADGYITQNRYLKVGTAKSVVNIELEKEDDGSEASTNSLSTSSGSVDNSTSKTSMGTSHGDVASSKKSAASVASTVSSNSSASSSVNQVIKGYYIYFDEPYGAEVYFDGSYIGVVPTSVPKISGNHEIILKQDGYQTKSYRVKIDKEEDNVKYEFPGLVKIEEQSSSSGNTSSSGSNGSTSSGNASTEASSEASTGASKESPTEASSESSTAEASDKASSKEHSAGTEGSTTAAGTGKTTKESEKAGDAASTASGEE